MRQGQQSRRGRGRGRKVQNPLSRNYESNGPEVKIRGTASHVAEKYTALARDALASGNIVMAENYFQHAEHYNRIIMAAQAQFEPANQPHAEATNGTGAQRSRRQPDQDGESRKNETAAMPPAGDGDSETIEEVAATKTRSARNGVEAPVAADSPKETANANGSGGGKETDGKSTTEDVPPDSAIA